MTSVNFSWLGIRCTLYRFASHAPRLRLGIRCTLYRFASHAPRLRLGIRCTHINTQKEPYAHKWSLAPFSYLHESLCVYIIPMPPPIGGAAGVSSLISATTDSVVNNVDATDVAFCNAERVTFTGSMIPASTMFT